MRRELLVVLTGVLLAVAGYAAGRLLPSASQRAMLRAPQPELAWLKHEFQISDAEFARVTALHDAYLPRCAELCRQIEERKEALRTAFAASQSLTQETDRLLAEIAQIRLECHRNMLRHFLEVSRTMPESQAKRYLDWVQARTILAEDAMAERHRHH